VRYAAGGIALPVLAGIVSLIALRVAAGKLAGEPREPSTPSAEFVALVAAVKAQLPPG